MGAALQQDRREVGIIFSAPMVRALLAGRKTQTRRIIEPAPEAEPDGMWGHRDLSGLFAEHVFGHCLVKLAPPRYGSGRGDRLWVREAFTQAFPEANGPFVYRADEQDGASLRTNRGKVPWTSPIFMPRKASRLTLVINEIRAERLQSITEADAIAEGVEGPGPGVVLYGLPENDGHDGKPGFSMLGVGTFRSARAAYACGFNALNGAGTWERNPWVWVLDFKVER